MRVGELCQKLGIRYRDVRYVLEQGILPRGVDENPGRGEHRDLDAAQAFWLGIVLMLKSSGIKTPLAGKIADYARFAVRGITQNMNWEWPFNPFAGELKTENKYYVDIGDLKYVRVATTAGQSEDQLYEFQWADLAKHPIAVDITPVVIVRIDLAQLAHLLSA